MRSVEVERVVTLARAAACPDLVGGKAGTLAALVAHGLPVPEGLVLTGPVLEEVLAANGTSIGCATEHDVLVAPWPDEVSAAVARISDHFGDVPLAVRSSAALEDGATASFAGQYESVLGVRGPAALEQAVRRCWASAFSERVRGYWPRPLSGARDRAAMSVLVQRLVEPETAGVAFTADPVTGVREEVMVSAVAGLGEPLVSGAVDGDQWRVRGGIATAASVTGQALTRRQAESVAALALEVERILGGPQDVEWAMAEHRLVVLQSRPVTALPVAPDVRLPPGSWVKETARYAEPFHAFAAALAARMVADGLTAMNAEYGGLVDRFEMLMVGGEAYLRVVPVGGRAGPPPPWWVLAVLSRLVPAIRRRMRTARTKLAPAALAAVMDDFDRVRRPRLAAQHRQLAAVPLRGLPDHELDAHLGRVVAFVAEAMRLHFMLIPAEIVPLFDLVELCRRRLGWSTATTLELVAGSSAATTEPSTRLAEIATRIRADEAARAVVDAPGGDTLLDRLSAAAPETGRLLQQWCDDYAVRCLSDDPASPTLAECPALVAELLREQVAAASPEGSAGPAHRDDAVRRARRLFAAKGPRASAELERTLALAQRAYGLRETSAFWTASMPGGLVRFTMLETGRRLRALGLLHDPEEVTDVDIDTVRGALRGDLEARRAVPQQLIRHRAERAWVLAQPGPPLLGEPAPPPPDLRGLPSAGRRLNQAMLWSRQAQAGDDRTPDGTAALTGIGACSGRHTGRVRVLRGPEDFDRLRRGDVLVCATTDPAWSILFGLAGALVTDRGGLLSHAAIVAREYGIPAVLGTGCASTALVDDELVTVDGGTGRVLRSVQHRLGVP